MPEISEFLSESEEFCSIKFTVLHSGRRIDHALSEISDDLTRSSLKQRLRLLTVNGKPVKLSAKLRKGDLVEAVWMKHLEPSFEPEEVDFGIIYRDNDLMIIDKPWNLTVHPAKGHETGTLANGVLHFFRSGNLDESFGAENRPGIVHRLDKDTRGLMIVALNAESAYKLCSAFKERRVKKIYKAVVKGMAPDFGVVDKPIGRSLYDRKKMAVVPGGRPSVTEFKILERLNGASLIACNLLTGRTHQIRVHMASLGHPVLGDLLYGKTTIPLPGMALLASYLKFEHPKTGMEMEFKLPDPPEFLDLLQSLRE